MPRWVVVGGAVLGSVGLAVLLAAILVMLEDDDAANRPPVIGGPHELRVLVGDRLESALAAADADGDELQWSAERLPAGARLESSGLLQWSPTGDEVGTYDLQVTARDPQGASDTTTVVIRVRHDPHPELYVALGDSVASGHGLEWLDWLGRDPCWRDHDDSYPAQFLEQQQEGPPTADAGLRDLALVACSGHTSRDVLVTPVDGGPALGVHPPRLPQLEWAVLANPGLVSITIGANDLAIGQPEEAITDDGEADESYLKPRLERLHANLTRILQRLVDTTDTPIMVTTYYNPTAEKPHGVKECRGSCFRKATDHAVGELNRTIHGAAAQFSSRVTVADVASAFEGRGAPNGRGPDVLRGFDGPSWLPAPLRRANAVLAYCARGHDSNKRTFISAADCIHPNQQGAKAIAEVLMQAQAAPAPPSPPDRDEDD